MKNRLITLIILLAFATNLPAQNTVSGIANPLDVVKLIGDKLIRDTPFKYNLEIPEINRHFNGLHYVDFGRTFGLKQDAVAYAYTRLVSDRETDLTIQIAHNDGCRIWVNGEMAYEKRGKQNLNLKFEERSVEMAEHFTARLKKGENTLLIKSETYGNEWVVYLQPPGLKGAVVEKSVYHPEIGLKNCPLIDPKIAGLTNWLIIGPFANPDNKGLDIPYPPEKEMVFAKMYEGANALVTWTIPKVEIIGSMIDPLPWGTNYTWNYHNGGVAWGMQQLAEATGEKIYDKYASDFCDFHINGAPFVNYQVKTLRAVNSANSGFLFSPLLDFTLAPALPFIYRLRKEQSFENRSAYITYIDRMLKYAKDEQVRFPGSDIYTRLTPEKYTTWVDDMFMGIPFLIQAAQYATTPEEKKIFLEDAANQAVRFNDQVWDKEASLYMHAKYSEKEVKLPHWSRANGWGIWATTEVLKVLPKSHPNYKILLSHYRKHVDALVALQNKNGFWLQVLDRPDSREEVSGTAIFTMAIARGITNGWLNEKKYKPVALKGWEALKTQIEPDGTVHNICYGTMCSEDINYYLNRPFYDNDTHGLFAVLFAGIEMSKMMNKGSVLAQKKNTVLLPVKLSDEEIVVVLKDIEKAGARYDPEVHLVRSTQSVHYHSDVKEETKVHSTLASFNYAVALLDSRIPGNRKRAFEVLRAVIALQDQNPNSKTCGVWPYSLEEPLATKKTPADRNWADFCAVPLIGIINNHNDILPGDLKDKIKNALLLASREIRMRDVRPDYTNISLMGLYVCYMTSDMYNDSDLMVYARKRLKSFYQCTLLNKGFIEYNSPAYFKLSLDEVLRLKERVINQEDHAMLDSVYNIGWSIVARHYHQPSAQWAGPHGRAYNVLLSPATYNWLYSSSGGKINPQTAEAYSKDSNPILKHRIPDYLIQDFIAPKLPRMEIDTFIRGGQKIELNPMVSYQESDKGVWIKTKEVIGKSWFTRDFVLSSANQACLWNQRRPLIAYWGTEQKPVSMQIRFLHDFYDYASANIFCAQDSTNVLGAINFTTNGGDRHVTIDVIQNATIKATDLRLRFEFTGDLNSISFAATDQLNRLVTGSSGKVNFRIELPLIKFGGYNGTLATGGDAKNKWIDFVIYSGAEREFNFEKIQEAIIGFLVTIKNDQIPQEKMVAISQSGEYMELTWQNLHVKAMIKPYAERATLVMK